MKNLIHLIFLLSFFQSSIYAQTNTTKRKPTSEKPEIDKLADKYLDGSKITLYTSHGELYGNVEIEYNSEDRAQAVKVQIESKNLFAIREFIKNLVASKEKQGYKQTDGEDLHNFHYDEMSGYYNMHQTYRKEKMYFILDCSEEIIGNKIDSYSINSETMYKIKFKTGDMLRKAGRNATNFEF